MKKLLLFSLSAALVLSSCTKTDFVTPSLEGDLTFTSSINSALTRVTGTAFDEGDAISVFANDGASYVAENVKYESVSGVFTSASPIVSDGSALSFVAVYPYSSDMAVETYFTVSADQSTEATYESSDLLSAVTASTTETCPELTFSHALSAVQVNVSSEIAASDVKVYGQVEVDCDFAASEFAGTGDVAAISAYAAGESTFGVILAPQTIASGAQFIEVTVDGETSVWSVSGAVTLESGYKYVCTVTVVDGKVKFEGSIEPWTDGGVIDATIGGESESIEVTLAELSADNVPSENTWIITDASVTAATDFAGLTAAFMTLSDSDREISLEFPNMESFPNYSMHGKSSSYGASFASEAIVSISAPNATYAGTNAFSYMDNLRSINFPKLKEVLNYTFTYSASLVEIDLPALETLGTYVFYVCKALETINLPEAKNFGNYTLGNCTALVSVNAPKVETVNFASFYNCTELKTVNLESAVEFGTSTNSSVFYQCYALESIELPKAELLGKWTFNKCTSLKSIDLPEATEFGVLVFNGCTVLESVNTPKLVTLGSTAFQSSGIKSYTIPATLETMGYNPFSQCKSISSITVENTNWVYDADLQVLFDGEKSSVIAALIAGGKTSIELPSSVTTIGQYAFYYYETLASLSAPGLTTVDSGALWYCTGLNELKWSTLEGTVLSSYTKSALYGATLTDVDLTIGSSNADKVTDNTIDLTTETLTFKSITVADDAAEAAGYALADISADNVPEGDVWVITDETSTSNGDFAGLQAALIVAGKAGREISLVFPNLLEMQYNSLLSFTDVLPVVSIELDVIESIGSRAFAYCEKLKSISMPRLIEGNYGLFEACTALETVVVATETTLTQFGDKVGDVFATGTVGNIDITIGETNKFDTEAGTITVPILYSSTTEYTYGPFKSVNGVAPAASASTTTR